MVEMFPNLSLRNLACRLIRRTGFPFFFLLFPFVGISQDLSIHGFAEDYKGETLSVLIYQDYITGTINEVGGSIINDDGSFMVTPVVEATSKIMIRIGSDEASFFVNP